MSWLNTSDYIPVATVEIPILPTPYSDVYEGTSKFPVWIEYQLHSHGKTCFDAGKASVKPELLAAANAALDEVDALRAKGHEEPAWAPALRAAIAKGSAA